MPQVRSPLTLLITNTFKSIDSICNCYLPFVFVHTWSIIFPGMFNIWEVVDKLAAVAKKELFYIWPFGLSAYLAGVVFIDRSNAKGAYKQLKLTSEVMVKNKVGIIIYYQHGYFPAATIPQTRDWAIKFIVRPPLSITRQNTAFSFSQEKQHRKSH